jgi:hypothetical protein
VCEYEFLNDRNYESETKEKDLLWQDLKIHKVYKMVSCTLIFNCEMLVYLAFNALDMITFLLFLLPSCPLPLYCCYHQ